MSKSCPDCPKQRRRIAELEAAKAELEAAKAELEAENARLRQLLDDEQRGIRRQAAPFSKGKPKSKDESKTSGRKSGDQHGRHGHRQPPEHVDEYHEAPLPTACPCCGGHDLHEDDIAVQYQTEILRRPVVRQFNIHRGHCQGCGQSVQGHHELQTSDALGAAASQLGPDAQAAIVFLNKDGGLSHGKVQRVFDTLFGISISRGTSAQVVLRAADRLQPVYGEIKTRLKASPVITPDETGWRTGGQTVWLHGWVGVDGVTCYHIDPKRSSDALQGVLGVDWSGTLVHDGWSSYDAFELAAHQQCQAHVLRRAHNLEKAASGAAKVFPRQVIGLLQESLERRDAFAAMPPKAAPREETRAAAFEEFRERLEALTVDTQADAANERFAKHLYHYSGEWFVFLLDPQVPATNWMGEQAMRPAVVNRKVWGGNRTDAGAEAQSITMSVLQTCKRQAVDALTFISQTLRGVAGSIFPTPKAT